MQGVGQQYAEKLDDAGEEKVGLGGEGVDGFPALQAKSAFEGKDGAFNTGTDAVVVNPQVCTQE